MTTKNDPARLQPLSSAVYCILLVLAEEERHGYAIKLRVEALTGGDVTLGPGTLYGALSRLLGLELIAEHVGSARERDDDERRRYYRLTARGRKVLVAEVERLRALAALARRVQLDFRRAVPAG